MIDLPLKLRKAELMLAETRNKLINVDNKVIVACYGERVIPSKTVAFVCDEARKELKDAVNGTELLYYCEDCASAHLSREKVIAKFDAVLGGEAKGGEGK